MKKGIKVSIFMNHNEKLEVLTKVASIFNEHHIFWRLGASCMLYLRGYVDHFDDIDVMIGLDDVTNVKELLKSYPWKERTSNEKYQTKAFLEYVIDGVEFDIMAGFAIVNEGKIHDCSLSIHDPYDILWLDDIEIYLSKVDTWLRYYQLMNREDKVKIILSRKDSHV